MPTSKNIDQSSFVIKTGMWFLMITIVLLFTAFTFGFFTTVRKDTGIELPNAFYISTIVLFLSSIILHRSRGQITFDRSPRVVSYTLLLGIAFLFVQGWGWYELYLQSSQVPDNQLQGFNYLYLLSGMHALHIVAAIIFLLYVILKFPGKGKRYLEIATYFWHFLGLLWIYLLAVLLINL